MVLNDSPCIRIPSCRNRVLWISDLISHFAMLSLLQAQFLLPFLFPSRHIHFYCQQQSLLRTLACSLPWFFSGSVSICFSFPRQIFLLTALSQAVQTPSP